MAAGRIFTIGPSEDFLAVLARSLLDGRLVKGFRYDPSDPLQLAKVKIYLPTRRAARVLRSEFVSLLGGRSAILPEIRPLGEVDEDAGFFDETSLSDDLSLPPPISPLARLVELGVLVLGWRNSLPDAIRDIHQDSPLAAPASPADAIWLAKSLADLIDGIETEETGWQGLDAVSYDNQAVWWQLTDRFLRIARDYWPARLAELDRSSPAFYRNALLRAEAERLRNLPAMGPTIVAGSTGSIPATADLMAAIFGHEQGTIVLPGLDLTLTEAQWSLAGALQPDGSRNGDPSSRSHPQYGLHQLLSKLKVTRADVVDLGTSLFDMAYRENALSVAFLSADAATNQHEWRTSLPEKALEAASAELALVEAANEREEALAIAIALKLGLAARKDSQVALITPDRDLARRVSAELRRFGIEADDSAGAPLMTSHHGNLVRLVLETVLRPGDPVALASLIKHPLVRLGRPAEEMSRLADRLELLCLRGGTSPAEIADLQQLVRDSHQRLTEASYSKIWQQPLKDPETFESILALAQDIESAVEPLASKLASLSGLYVRPDFPFSEWASATGRVLEALCRDEFGNLANLWANEAGDALASMLGELMDNGGAMTATGPQWVDVMTALLAGQGIKPKAMSHPRVFIWGTLEARLQRVDLLVLGGLNEGIWPAKTANNPLLSRTMKTGIGLEPPERRIGQSAHDFVMALGTENVVLTRSLRQSGAPSVASRFLQQLLSVFGDDIAKAMKQRGQLYLDHAEQVDIGPRQEFATRPDPRPPAEKQPTRYSFSEAGKLRRDPYSIYAHRVLRLDPVDPYNVDPGAAERGTIYHAIVERFIKEEHDPASPQAMDIMRRLAEEVFFEAALPAHVEAIWKPRFLDVAAPFLKAERERHPTISRSVVEARAGIALAGGQISLTGRADRIDIREDGKADIIDYKTGSSPSSKEARTLLDPQLSLEAAALRLGGFKDLPALETEDLLYYRLRPGAGFRIDTVNNEKSARTKEEDRRSANDLADQALLQMIRLTTSLREGKNGFKSRVAPFKDRDYGGEYDHLARVSEWSSADSDEAGEGDDV
ncbi:ATP-dependent helicase/nuclease subunit B [Rhizobium alvei]|uniref:Double-strand break repair protein AddB n=2 Tax=Rhizobium alvei TaxID=1132659 RepID=A0ABT8YLY3_9HYPH|nr:double-strand break repair protein AddB [Rhizobium alvei]MDO6964692.1 double-strand break repair protein AddB [Rhizobium alvei]